MLQTILGLAHYGLLLSFGTFVSAAFSGISITKKNIPTLSRINILLFTVQTLFYLCFGFDFTTKIYPFISHLPLVLILTYGYKRRLLSSVYSVTTAYLCCQISKWLGLLTLSLIPYQWFYYAVRCILLIFIGILLVRYIASLVSTILSKPPQTVLIFSILPFVYYLFDYGTVIYTNWLYSGNTIVYEFLPFTLSIFYLIFCVLYFKEYEQKNEVERRNQLLEIQSQQSVKEFELIRRREHELTLLRHDMRHYLHNILTYIENGNDENAISYIQNTIEAVDNTSIHRFCKNELVNTILSFYQGIMNNSGVRFNATVNINPILPCSEIDFTSILSNGLENAVKAVNLLPLEERIITLKLNTEENKLLLSIKNSYAKSPTILDGKPITDETGHGFGTESIRYVTEKLNGNCQFLIKNGFFILRVVL